MHRHACELNVTCRFDEWGGAEGRDGSKDCSMQALVYCLDAFGRDSYH